MVRVFNSKLGNIWRYFTVSTCHTFSIFKSSKLYPGFVLSAKVVHALCCAPVLVNKLAHVSCYWVLNEADTLKYSSILIYSMSKQNIYTQNEWNEAMLIKKERLNYRWIKEAYLQDLISELKLKTLLKQLLGYLPIAVMIPDPCQ